MDSNNKRMRKWAKMKAAREWSYWPASILEPEPEPEAQPQPKAASGFWSIKVGLATITVVLVAVSVCVLVQSMANKFTSDPYYVDTRSFKSGISEIGDLVQVDYTPMSRLATTLNEAVSLMHQMKHGASYALGKTGVSKEDAHKILHFFDQVAEDLDDTELVANKASEFYHEQEAQLSSIQESLRAMQRNIRKTNVPGFVREVKDIINMIETSMKEIRIIKDDLHKQNKKMTKHKGSANEHITKVKVYRNSAEEEADEVADGVFKTAVVIGGGVASFVNPLAGLGVVLMGMMEHGGIQENKQKTLKEYDNALAMLDETLEVLDGCVKAIEMIEQHLDAVRGNLNQIPRGAEKLLFELAQVEKEDVVITEEDREELNARFDSVLSLVKKSEKMYGSDRDTRYQARINSGRGGRSKN